MDRVHHSHEAYSSNDPHGPFPDYRAGYGSRGYGATMSPGGSLTGPGGSAKAAVLASGGNDGGLQRFPGRQQLPSGATPTPNQLLTSPSPVMRGYRAGYPDYNNPPAQLQASTGLAEETSSAAHGWEGQQGSLPTTSTGDTRRKLV